MLPKLSCVRLSHHVWTIAIVFYMVCLPYKSTKCNVFLNAAARLVSHAPRYCHVTPFLRELHWLPVRQRIDYKILLLTFKTIHGKSPVYLQELISVKMPGAYRLRSSSNGLLLEPPSFRTRATLGDRSLQVAAPKLWNALLHEIRSISNINTFKCHLKTYLFSISFS